MERFFDAKTGQYMYGKSLADTALSKKLTDLNNKPELSKRVDALNDASINQIEELGDRLEANLKVSGRKPKCFITKNDCLHGLDLPVVPSGSMHVTTAALYYFGELCASHTGNNPQAVGASAILRVFDKYPAITYDNNSRSVMKAALVRYATDELLLGGNAKDNDLSLYHFIFAKWCAEAISMIVTIEQMENIGPNKGMDSLMGSKARAKNEKELNNALGDGAQRGIIRYIEKRIPCNCLDELHERYVTEETKLGMCYGCFEVFDYASLRRCTGCGINHYCSKECQVKNWPEHKALCRLASRERKKDKKNATPPAKLASQRTGTVNEKKKK